MGQNQGIETGSSVNAATKKNERSSQSAAGSNRPGTVEAGKGGRKKRAVNPDTA
jgi:hypothetical protein